MLDEGKERRVLKLNKLNGRRRIQVILFSMASLAVSLFAGIAGPVATFDKLGFAGMHLSVSQKGWSDTFHFLNLYSNSLELFFTVNVNPRDRSEVKSELKKDIVLHLEWIGEDENGVRTGLYNGTFERPVHCWREGSEESAPVKCDPVLVFRDNFVTSVYYHFNVRIPPEFQSSVEFIETVDFWYRFENLKYAIWEIRLTYLCFGIAAFLSLYWFFTCRVDSLRHRSMAADLDEYDMSSKRRGICAMVCCCCPKWCCPYDTNSQRWILVLLIGLMMYNQPFYGFQYLDAEKPRAFFLVVSVSMQIFFACVLMMFWLFAFESLYLGGSQSRFIIAFRYIFFLSFWALGSGVYGYIVYIKVHNRVYDWWNDYDLNKSLTYFLGFHCVLYGAWLLFVILRATGHLASMNGNYKFVYVIHIWRIGVLLTGIGLGAFFYEDPRHSRFTFFFQFIVNLYIAELVYLYSPVAATSSTRSEGDEDVGVVGMDHGDGIEISSVTSRNGRADSQGSNKDTSITQVNLALV